MEKSGKASSSGAKAPKKDSVAAKALAKEQKRKKQEQKAMKKEKKKSTKAKKGDGKTNSKEEVDDDVDDEEFERMVADLMARDAEHNAVSVEKLTEHPSCRACFSMTLAGYNPQEGCVIFGGELFDGATSKCYDDLLRFRFLPNSCIEWRRITSPNSPPPRCAHASCITPTHMYIFGGEFSTAWRFHHYNDLWRLDFKTNQWTAMPSLNGPSARSGSRMVAWKNYLVLFGGFYEASRGVRWHDDLHLYDLRTEKWVKVKFNSTSQQPSPRSGFQFAAHPNKPIVYLYGGYAKVAATASAQKGRAMDDMWLLHLSVPVGGKSASAAIPECRWEFLPRKGAPPSKRSGASSYVHKNRLLLFGGVSDTETQNDVVGEFHNSLHAFDMDRMRWYELKLRGSSSANKKKGGRRNKSGNATLTTSSVADTEADGEEEIEDDDEVNNNNDDDNDDSAAKAFGLRDDAFYVIIDGKFVLVEEESSEDEENVIEPGVDRPGIVEEQTKEIVKETIVSTATEAEDAKSIMTTSVIEDDSLAKQGESWWGTSAAPEPRISAGISVLGSKLYIYGGTAERGDVQITFDDMWGLDLNKMDAWQQVIEGRWREQEWAGADAEDSSSEEDDDDDDDDDDDEDDEEGESESGEDDDTTDENNIRGLAEEIKLLRGELGVDQEHNTPQPGELMKTFFTRTAQHWLDTVAARRLAREDHGRLSGKELRRMAFELAQQRFEILSPVLDKLNALQEAQRLAEEEAAEEAKELAIKLARRNAKKAIKKNKDAKKGADADL